MRDHVKVDLDDARLLPRLREHSPQLDRQRLIRQQATALTDAIADQPDRELSTREECTKPGDPNQLRGIPVVGARGVGGAIAGTNPESAWIAKEERASRAA